MSSGRMQLRRISFTGPKDYAELLLCSGINVICGASDTGKSYLAESLDFMLGGSELQDIPERTKYAEIALDIALGAGDNLRLIRSASGGNFLMVNLDDDTAEQVSLKQTHGHEKTNNLSGFLLEKIGLLGKRVLKSSMKSTTQSLSFRNIARLVIIQEGEIQQKGSPFWGGQFTLKTPELATIKMILTGIDDSSVVPQATAAPDNTKQITIIEELIIDLQTEIEDIGEDRKELEDQLGRLDASIEDRRGILELSQRNLAELLSERQQALEACAQLQSRLDEIDSLQARFILLQKHYGVDIERLAAIKESGSAFIHLDPVSCPLCGAYPESQHSGDKCDGNVEILVLAASSEIIKIKQLQSELSHTVHELERETFSINVELGNANTKYLDLDASIKETASPQLNDARTSFSTLVETKANVQKALDIFSRVEKLEERMLSLQRENDDPSSAAHVKMGLPDSIAHAFSLKISIILKAWNFPGECHVHFDKNTCDFVIDGKPRGSRGKGLRAITHAAVTVGLLEYCQEHDLPHPGFIVLDSPLLAYFKPECDEDHQLRGTDLKERFYQYLIDHHSKSSQIIIIENQHPPDDYIEYISMTIFTGNPNIGRFGLL